MSIKVTLDKTQPTWDKTQRTQIVRGTLALSGNYGTGTSHGDTLSFSGVPGIQSTSVPVRVFIYEKPAVGVAPSFYSAIFQPGATIASGAVNFSLAGTEYTEGSAYSGAIASAVWAFEAIFPLFL